LSIFTNQENRSLLLNRSFRNGRGHYFGTMKHQRLPINITDSPSYLVIARWLMPIVDTVVRMMIRSLVEVFAVAKDQNSSSCHHSHSDQRCITPRREGRVHLHTGRSHIHRRIGQKNAVGHRERRYRLIDLLDMRRDVKGIRRLLCRDDTPHADIANIERPVELGDVTS